MITTTATWTTTENLPHAGKALDEIRRAMDARPRGSRLYLDYSIESVEMLTSSTAGREMDAATIRRDTSDMGAQQRARSLGTITARADHGHSVETIRTPRMWGNEMFSGQGALADAYLPGDATPAEVCSWLIAMIEPWRLRPSDLTPESPEWMRQMVAYYHDLPRDERGPEAARRIFGDVAEPRDEYEVEQ